MVILTHQKERVMLNGASCLLDAAAHYSYIKMSWLLLRNTEEICGSSRKMGNTPQTHLRVQYETLSR